MVNGERGKFFLIAEKSFQAVFRRRVRVLGFKFPPVIDIRVVHTDFSPHFREFSNDEL